MLPALKEEATPVVSPARTLARTAAPLIREFENREYTDYEHVKKIEQVSYADVVMLSDEKNDVVYIGERWSPANHCVTDVS
jgi:hypothetical protein